jgi:hypothetical protein
MVGLSWNCDKYLGLLVILTMGLFGGLLSRLFAFNTGVQFMGYYVAILTVPALVGLFQLIARPILRREALARP